MANVSKDDSNIKVGLILVKSEVTEKGVCFSSFSSSENISCKCSDKWIVVAGNNYSVKQVGKHLAISRPNGGNIMGLRGYPIMFILFNKAFWHLHLRPILAIWPLDVGLVLVPSRRKNI